MREKSESPRKSPKNPWVDFEILFTIGTAASWKKPHWADVLGAEDHVFAGRSRL